MTLRPSLTIKQVGPGAPLSIIATLISPLLSDFTWSDWGIGATASTTPPSTFADLTHYDSMYLSANADTFQQSQAQSRSPGDVDRSYSDTETATLAVRATGNYAPGKHLWLVVFDMSPPSGTDTVRAVSNLATVI